MPKFLLILSILFFQEGICLGQNEAEINSSLQDSSIQEINILGGYNYSSKHIIEVGLAFRQWTSGDHHSGEVNLALSNEFVIDDELIIGPKVSAWMAGGAAAFALGITLINYTDFNRNELNFRPEVGIGFSGAKVTYGYNAKLLGNGFDQIGNHSINISLPLARFSK
jgi:hypothetical protein